jgi:hypothetical protein
MLWLMVLLIGLMAASVSWRVTRRSYDDVRR